VKVGIGVTDGVGVGFGGCRVTILAVSVGIGVGLLLARASAVAVDSNSSELNKLKDCLPSGSETVATTGGGARVDVAVETWVAVGGASTDAIPASDTPLEGFAESIPQAVNRSINGTTSSQAEPFLIL
jgi:hypothetical protein